MEKPRRLPDQSWRAVTEMAQYSEVEGYLLDEIFDAIGLGAESVWRRLFGPAFKPILRRFMRNAESFDNSVQQSGFQLSAQNFLKKWTSGLQVEGEAKVPTSGPLLIAANHPGTYDALAVASSIPRQDLKIVASANPVFRALPNTREFFIYATSDTHVRMSTIRRAIRQLQSGGAVLIFSSGKLDPDPRYFPDAARLALKRWHASLEMFLRKVPETRMVVAINSGFVAPEFMGHPLTRIRRSDEAKQKLAEFIQIIQQMILDKRVKDQPLVAFSQPFLFPDISTAAENLQTQISQIAQQLIENSSNRLRGFPGKPS